MSLFPQIQCEICHRHYSSFRAKCPYCGTSKAGKNEPDASQEPAAVRASTVTAPHRTPKRPPSFAPFGAIVLAAIVAVVIVGFSVSVSNYESQIEEEQAAELEDAAAGVPTPVPSPTAEPTPSPTPMPTVTSIQITWYGMDQPGFYEPIGSQVQLDVIVYPTNTNSEVIWTSSDPSVATVDETGLVTCVGAGYCTITAQAGEISDVCEVWTS